MRTVRAVLTVKRAVYLLLSLGLGTTWFVILVVGLSTGIGLPHHAARDPDPHRGPVRDPADGRSRARTRPRPARRARRGPLPPPGQGRHLVVDHGARRRPADLEGHRVPRVPVPAGDHLVRAHVDRDPPAAGAPDGTALVLAGVGRDRRPVLGRRQLPRGVPPRADRRAAGRPRPVPHRRHGHRARLLGAAAPALRARPGAHGEGGRRRAPRRRGSSPRPTPSAAASSATCTTARSSASSPSASSSAWPASAWATTPTAWRCSSSTRRRRSPAPRSSELRDLARGIHPAVLCRPRAGRRRCDELASRATVPTRSSRRPRRGCCPPSRRTAYFVVAECLTNIGEVREGDVGDRPRAPARSAGSSSRSSTTASAVRTPSAARACAGSPTASARSSGSLEVASPRGHGTRVRAEIPLVGG